VALDSHIVAFFFRLLLLEELQCAIIASMYCAGVAGGDFTIGMKGNGYELYILFNQRTKSRKCVCDHCPWLYHGVRYREDAEFCPWRCYHDRCLCGADQYDKCRTSSCGSSIDRSCGMYGIGSSDRADRL